MTIKESQVAVDQWIKTIGVRYFSELTNMTILTEEVGELARVMSRKYGDQSFKQGEKDNLGEEMADILWVLICLANQTGVDLTAELQKSFDKQLLWQLQKTSMLTSTTITTTHRKQTSTKRRLPFTIPISAMPKCTKQ